MPEEALATPPDVTTTDAPPATPEPSGIDKMMAQLDAAAASGKTVEPKPVSDGKPAAAPAPKPEVKPETAKPAAPAPAAKPEDKPPDEPDWSKAPPKWHKIYEGHKQKTSEEIKRLQAQIKSLETKPFEQPGDARKLEALEKQLEEIRGESTNYKKRLAQLDYSQSDDYRTQFIEPATAVASEAVDYISRIKVNDGADGATRPGTKADWDYIRSLPIDARRRVAKEMFGEASEDVLDFTKDIDRIKRNAKIAIDRHSENHEKVALEREGTTKRQQAEYEGTRKASLEAIQNNEQYGKWFREDEADPEASKLLREGYSEIERITAQLDKLPMAQQAAYSAMFMARAAAAPRLLLEINRISAERDAFKEELEKIRGTDPGADPKPGDGGLEKTTRMGIDGAAAVFDQAPR